MVFRIMSKKSDTLRHEKEPISTNQSLRHKEALEALRRLREIGENLPPVDAALIVREGRNLAGQGSR
jgi:hypothetical protein